MYPDPNRLRVLEELLASPGDDALPRLHDLADANPWLQAATNELAGIPLDRWQGEHTRLFISSYPKTLCPPYASAYREGRMQGSVTAELDALYREIGLEPAGVPADYLGTLLECAAYLADTGGELRDTHWPALWGEYIASWVPRFAEDLTKYAQVELYRILGRQLAELFAERQD